jgi:serine/threonine protein kinase
MFENDLHQIDMELCMKSLGDEIKLQTTCVRELLSRMKTSSDDILPTMLQMKVTDIIEILSQVLEDLRFIHEQKEVHRDLKPENSDDPQAMSY